jgi:hypothetical protein
LKYGTSQPVAFRQLEQLVGVKQARVHALRIAEDLLSLSHRASDTGISSRGEDDAARASIALAELSGSAGIPLLRKTVEMESITNLTLQTAARLGAEGLPLFEELMMGKNSKLSERALVSLNADNISKKVFDDFLIES